MADGARCTCAYCRVCGLMWPAMLITTGVLFLIGEYSRFSFHELWPVLFIAHNVPSAYRGSFGVRKVCSS